MVFSNRDKGGFKLNTEQTKKIMINIIGFIKDVDATNDSIEILNHIFEFHLLKSSEKKSFNNFIDHISIAFEVNPNYLIDYMTYNESLTINDSELENDSYADLLNFINKLKKKYGLIISNLLSQNRDPFMLSGADVNVKNNGSIHNLRVIRADGESLSMNFDSSSIMATSLAFTQALSNSIEIGIFSLDPTLVNHYLDANKNLIQQLAELLERKDD